MTEQRPRFSVLIPTAGNPALIRAAVRSVLQQTERDFEVVVVDLGGNDPAIRDVRVRYFKAPPGGPFTTWDYAAKQARGEYVLWLDDDNQLFPFALEFLRRAIEKSHADIITANHLYYYDATHPRRALRNSLGVIPWSDETRPFDPREAIRALFAFEKRGAGKSFPRFHFSATAFSRRVVDAALARLGFVLFPDGLGIHSLQPILFAFAKTGLFVDHPIVLVGRLGISMGQDWALKARERMKRLPWKPFLSPVSGYTKINGILDGYLRAQAALPDLLGNIPIRYDRFAELHGKELLYLDTSAHEALRNWKSYFHFVHTLPEEMRGKVLRRGRRWALAAPFIYISRRLGLNRARRLAEGLCASQDVAGGEGVIPAGEEIAAGVDLAAIAARAVLDKTGKDVLKY